MDNVISKDAYVKNINILSNSSSYEDFDIVFAILDIDKIYSKNDFDLIIGFLTNHPTPIREALSQKLNDYILYNEDYFLDNKTIEILLDAVIDINPNVSRAICDLFDKSKKMSKPVEEKLIYRINNLIDDLKIYETKHKDNFFDSKKLIKNHAKNKKLFSLYWYLEALSVCLSDKCILKITEILNYTINFSDYTIREKTAKILNRIKNPPLELLQKANCDQNFYVKIQVYDKINNDD